QPAMHRWIRFLSTIVPISMHPTIQPNAQVCVLQRIDMDEHANGFFFLPATSRWCAARRWMCR
ncbi:hypothetical protein G3N88_02850, partial [Xanthomonas hortorum pv. gardneri]|uniref:hypothetical protein n=1 Tax=Xanthomonas hortorum TaxID=56454 RepID=UPI002FE2BF8D